MTHHEKNIISVISVTPECLYIKEGSGKLDVENQCGGSISLTTTIPGVPNDVLGDGYQSWGDSALLEKWLNSYLHTIVPMPFKAETDFRLGGTIGDKSDNFMITGMISTDIIYSLGLLLSILMTIVGLFLFAPCVFVRKEKDHKTLSGTRT